MAFKTMNRTIEEVERLSKLINNELQKINPDTLSVEEVERLEDALSYTIDFHDSIVGDEDEEGEDDESL